MKGWPIRGACPGPEPHTQEITHAEGSRVGSHMAESQQLGTAYNHMQSSQFQPGL